MTSIQSSNAKILLVGICGGSSSGKTKICSIIENTVGKEYVTVVSMDNYYKGLSEDERKYASDYNFDIPDAFDEEKIYNDIVALKNGQIVNIPVYSFITHRRETDKTIKINPNKVIIFEGILIFESLRIRNLFDIKVFIDATPETRLARRIKRDIKERGRDVDSVEDQYERFVIPSYKKFILPIRDYVDIIIPNNNGNTFIGVGILCDSIKHRIEDK